MATQTLPDREYVREVLDHDPTTGELRWRARPLTHFRTLRGCNMWNAKYAGTIAGTVDIGGYRRIRIPRMTAAHRLVWLYVRGKPVPAIIDHIDHDKLNNRIGNLRAATRAENSANSGKRRHNTSGAKGVHFNKKNQCFIASIGAKRQKLYLGSFATLEAATAARRDAAERLHGKFARHE